eukprot:2497853-Amphidinium_carterae.1
MQDDVVVPDISLLRAEAVADAAQIRSYTTEASATLAKLIACREKEAHEPQVAGGDKPLAINSNEQLQAERERLAHIERLAGDGVLRAGVVVSRLRERLAAEQSLVALLREEASEHHGILRRNNAEWLEEVNRLKRQVVVQEQTSRLTKLELQASETATSSQPVQADQHVLRSLFEDFRHDVSGLLEEQAGIPAPQLADMRCTLQELLQEHAVSAGTKEAHQIMQSRLQDCEGLVQVRTSEQASLQGELHQLTMMIDSLKQRHEEQQQRTQA